MHRKPPLLACALLLLLAGCAVSTASGPSLSPEAAASAASVQTPEPSAPAEPVQAPEPPASPEPAQTPKSAPEPSSAPAPAPTPEPTPTRSPVEPYEFGTPLEEGGPVEDDTFFDTAVFLGDSRTEGFQLYSGMKHGDFYWARGMTVFKADSEEYRPFEVDGQYYSMMEALGLKQYDNVYIMLGVNELGYAAELYEEGLSELLDKILAVQPEAVVYLQLMPPLNDAVCRQNNLGAYINNENLARFNEAIVRLAAEKQVVLLNTAEVYTGEDGQLPVELAGDGCHFAVQAYARWADYLRTHTIDRDRYFGSREQAQQELVP